MEAHGRCCCREALQSASNRRLVAREDGIVEVGKGEVEFEVSSPTGQLGQDGLNGEAEKERA